MAPCRARPSSTLVYIAIFFPRFIAFNPLFPIAYPVSYNNLPLPQKTPPGGRVMAGGYLTLSWAHKRLKRPLICNCGLLYGGTQNQRKGRQADPEYGNSAPNRP